MKKDNLFKTVVVMGALALMVGGVITADAAVNTNSQFNKGNKGNQEFLGLTEAERSEKITERSANQAANRAEMEIKREAVQLAISNGSYEEWVLAIGSDHPLTTKINAENFSRFVEAHTNIENGRAIFEELGINGEPGMGGHRGSNRGQGGLMSGSGCLMQK